MGQAKLSYEEWRAKYIGTVTISEEAQKGLKDFHNLDAATEVESAIRKEYEFYLNDGLVKQSTN